MAINPREHKPEETKTGQKKPRKTKYIFLTLLVAASVSGTAFRLLQNKPARTGQDQVTTKRPQPAKTETTKTATAPVVPKTWQESAAEDIKGNDATPSVAGKEEITPAKQLPPGQQCGELAPRLADFFHHLDQEPYIREFRLGRPSEQYFNALTAKLLAHPPTVTRESDDLYTILTNMAHFFRVIGKQNILLMKGILDRERDKIEDVAADLYKWAITNQCSGDGFSMQAPLDKVYEYAGFFLNTMGGRSYLFRRDSRSRLLVNYYAILIIDQANINNLNLYGLDIKPLIPKLIREIEATNQLIYKEDYIDHLLDLQEKYQ